MSLRLASVGLAPAGERRLAATAEHVRAPVHSCHVRAKRRTWARMVEIQRVVVAVSLRSRRGEPTEATSSWHRPVRHAFNSPKRLTRLELNAARPPLKRGEPERCSLEKVTGDVSADNFLCRMIFSASDLRSG